MTLLPFVLLGTTPQRKEFRYPRVLTRMNKHDELLKAFREEWLVQEAANTPVPAEDTCDNIKVSVWEYQGQCVKMSRSMCENVTDSVWEYQGQCVKMSRSMFENVKVSVWISRSMCENVKVNVWKCQGQCVNIKVNVWKCQGQCVRVSRSMCENVKVSVKMSRSMWKCQYKCENTRINVKMSKSVWKHQNTKVNDRIPRLIIKFQGQCELPRSVKILASMCEWVQWWKVSIMSNYFIYLRFHAKSVILGSAHFTIQIWYLFM